MGRNDSTSRVIDEVIKFSVTTAAVGGIIALPGLALGLEKPLAALFNHLDKRSRERELRRVLYYMKEQNYLSGDYLHGLQLTDKAKQRLKQRSAYEITPAETWDKRWRVIIYDIPEKHKTSRDKLTHFLRLSGCYQLQRSTCITPFACRDVIETICARLHVDEYISYFEALNLDNEHALLEHVKARYPYTKF